MQRIYTSRWMIACFIAFICIHSIFAQPLERCETSQTWQDLQEQGFQALVSEDHAVAISRFTCAIALSPENALLYAQRAFVYNLEQRYEEALADLNRSIALAPTPEAYNNRGENYMRLNRVEEAMSDFLRSVELQPDVAAPLINLGVLYYRQNDFERALMYFDQAIQVEWYSHFAFINRAQIYFEQGEFQQAISDLARASWLAPDDYIPNYRLGLVFVRLYMFEEAEFELNIAYTKSSGAPEVRVALADIYTAFGIPNIGLSSLGEVLEEDPTNVDAYTARGRVYIALRDYEAALNDFNQALQLDAEDADAYLYRAEAYRYMNDVEAALSDYHTSIRLRANDGRGYIGLAMTLLNMGQVEEAFDNLQIAYTLNPREPSLYAAYAIAYAMNGDVVRSSFSIAGVVWYTAFASYFYVR